MKRRTQDLLQPEITDSSINPPSSHESWKYISKIQQGRECGRYKYFKFFNNASSATAVLLKSQNWQKYGPKDGDSDPAETTRPLPAQSPNAIAPAAPDREIEKPVPRPTTRHSITPHIASYSSSRSAIRSWQDHMTPWSTTFARCYGRRCIRDEDCDVGSGCE